MNGPIRILVADDHPIVRDGLRAVLETQPDLVVVGEAASGPEVLEQVAGLGPDILLLDLEMPDLDGVQVLRALATQGSPVRVLVFTAYDADAQVMGAVQAGAQGYLLKGAPREELFRAVRTVAGGGVWIQPQVARTLVGHVRGDADPLTPREQEVLQLVAQGLANKQIAARLGITERTVKLHVSNILGKLGATNRTDAATLAVQRGLVRLQPRL